MNKSDRFVADKLKFDYKEKLKLKELLNGAYTIQPTFNGTWISDNEITYIRENGDFVILDVLTANITVIIYAHLMVSRLIFSDDGALDRFLIFPFEFRLFHFLHSIFLDSAFVETTWSGSSYIII